MQKIWEEYEIQILKSIFMDRKNIDISNQLNRSITSIQQKAHKLGLKKSKKHKSSTISIRNKIYGRDLNFDITKNIALKYNSRSEFQQMDASAYSTARKGGYLDEICKHMKCLSFSIPQLMLKKLTTTLISNDIRYNDRSTIYPYEIDIFVPKYKLSFEYNGKRWHLNNKNDKIKFDKLKQIDIKLFTFVENNRNYESDIKTQFISYLIEINKICNLNITIDDVNQVDISTVYKEIIATSMISEICFKYNIFSDFRKKECRIYTYLIKSGDLEKYTSHMIKIKPIIESDVVTLISKYTYLCDLIKENRKFYTWIKKHQKEYLLKDLILKQNKKLKYIFLLGAI